MMKVRLDKTLTDQNVYVVCCILTDISAGEMYYTSMLEELEKDGKDFEADSWSLAVDSSYLQSQRKDVIKRQDVIYGETSLFSDLWMHLHCQPDLAWI